ncbi:GRAS family transcription factor isoform 3 [Hibiscus syriacus]|uniref:GRAS family transcription factor isoform 3 n=1 Tax=Hibiscus syriacus TaxID=106335 RepID=A0A6A3B760_HIBSY|nr:GRAS family transcription factor isoform 3 [Hibiscus syriacus]
MNMNVPVAPSEPGSGALLQPVSIGTDGNSNLTSTGWSLEGESLSPSDDSDSTDPVLKYITQMLMEENLEEPHMFNDYLALKDTEQSLYEVLGEHILKLYNHNSNGTGNYIDHQGVGEAREPVPSLLQAPLNGDYNFQATLQELSLQFPVNSTNNNFSNTGNGTMESSVSELLSQNIFNDKESVLQFQRGFEEASKFLPSSNQLIIDLESNSFPMGQKGKASNAVAKVGKEEQENSHEGLRGRKNHERDLEDSEEESNKQSATYMEETELSDMFDKVLLCPEGQPICCFNDESVQHRETKALQQKEKSNGAGVGKTRSRKQGKKETVDLRTLLILCAQAISADDHRTAGELLKQIKDNSTPLGDGTQRLAHVFANGLEARLDGSGTVMQNFYASLASKKTTTADMLKSYKRYLSACPFLKLPIMYGNKMIYHMAGNASALHIVDFGILYGFQWPILIQHLSKRPGGPPKLRITGIELPQRGFRPTERIEATGRRLANYCKRFNVPFEYKAIAAQNWETLRVEDIKINSNEFLAVKSLFRFENLLDETAEVDCPRNAVLKEALFHLSAVFDMFDNTLPRDEPARLMFESEFYGQEAVNVIASEGPARVQRPETYKQWQIRMTRSGFEPLPLNQELMKDGRAGFFMQPPVGYLHSSSDQNTGWN